ncbi:hypothetical protein TSAR_008922 [Trichomalopsis sarcophagae]|uniref:Uncharacterized protein n=1 Tax=Trichomalopsis sarcophagae TaxID=543379 RepID=A0A232EQW4_9HYME|nr:hypothetical protein TSAR_008922 [Trichomalopsis sarcophagae]
MVEIKVVGYRRSNPMVTLDLTLNAFFKEPHSFIAGMERAVNFTFRMVCSVAALKVISMSCSQNETPPTDSHNRKNGRDQSCRISKGQPDGDLGLDFERVFQGHLKVNFGFLNRNPILLLREWKERMVCSVAALKVISMSCSQNETPPTDSHNRKNGRDQSCRISKGQPDGDLGFDFERVFQGHLKVNFGTLFFYCGKGKSGKFYVQNGMFGCGTEGHLNVLQPGMKPPPT